MWCVMFANGSKVQTINVAAHSVADALAKARKRTGISHAMCPNFQVFRVK